MTAASKGRHVTAPDLTIEQFEALEFDPGEFNHEAHVFMAWSYLRRVDLLEAIDRYRATLRRLTARLGIPDKYHETITWFYLIAVAERVQKPSCADWRQFKDENPDLFARGPSIIRRYYSEQCLSSAHAKNQFVLPDLAMMN